LGLHYLLKEQQSQSGPLEWDLVERLVGHLTTILQQFQAQKNLQPLPAFARCISS
jgi:hypothetical protein